MSAAEKIKPLLVRPNDAAKMIGCGRAAFFEMLRRGEIRRLKYGRTTLIEVAELERWVERVKGGG